jgi:hypothetical protein
MSMTPAAGLTFGGGGGKAAWASALAAVSEQTMASSVLIEASPLVVWQKS